MPRKKKNNKAKAAAKAKAARTALAKQKSVKEQANDVVPTESAAPAAQATAVATASQEVMVTEESKQAAAAGSADDFLATMGVGLDDDVASPGGKKKRKKKKKGGSNGNDTSDSKPGKESGAGGDDGNETPGDGEVSGSRSGKEGQTADEFLAAMGLDDAPGGGSGTKKKKRKKKPKKPASKGEAPVKPKGGAMSEMARRAAARKAQLEAQRQEEERQHRIRQEEEEEEERLRQKEEEEREQIRLRRAEKRKARKEAEKAEGITRAQKETLQAKRDAMGIDIEARKAQVRERVRLEKERKAAYKMALKNKKQQEAEEKEREAAAKAAQAVREQKAEAESKADQGDGGDDDSEEGDWEDWEAAMDEMEDSDNEEAVQELEPEPEPEPAPAPKPAPVSKKKKSAGRKKLTRAQKRQLKQKGRIAKELLKAQNRRNQNNDVASGSDSGSESDSYDGSEESVDTASIELSRARMKKNYEEAMKKRSPDKLRCPIVCVMGHVDTGKTKILDKIRRTSVQDAEAGGITQQIGATFLPPDFLKKKTKQLNKKWNFEMKIPGLLMIDTPGHESFGNLRSRGSNLCDIAILVIDIMHALEPQTIESINLLKKADTPFIVALNKIDRIYGWKATPDNPVRASLAAQDEATLRLFQERAKQVRLELMQQGLNAELYFENDSLKDTVSMVPTSAHSGEGIQDLLLMVMQMSQKTLTSRIMALDFLQCTVMEVKVIEGHGTTVDVMLVNGTLRLGDTIILCGLNGPIQTNIRALLTPKKMRDMRVKNEYEKHQAITGARGVKIAAEGVDQVVAGTELLVLTPEYHLDHLEDDVMAAMDRVQNLLSREARGVHVQASTLGSLEALLEFLRTIPIPVASFAIGPVSKRDVLSASIMLEHKMEYATILAFDVKVNADAKMKAQMDGVKIFTADIIYHLFDKFTEYITQIQERRREESKDKAVFPVVLDILGQYVFNKKNPIVVGVKVFEGILKAGTPLCFVKRTGDTQTIVKIGTVASVERNNEEVERASAGQEVAVKIEQGVDQAHIMYGRQFDAKDRLYSVLTRKSIDLLKENFKDDLTKKDWLVVVKLKKMFNIL